MDVITVAAEQQAGGVVGESRQGFVRSELRVDFKTTMKRLTELVDKAEALGVHAENLFWKTRENDLRIYGYCTRKGEQGAGKICRAAWPMLNEILGRMSYVCGTLDDFDVLGEGEGDTVWTTPDWDMTAIEITNIVQFASIGVDPNYPLSGKYRLMRDLDATDFILSPIGNLLPFTGEFDGAGHTISNVSVESEYNVVGLFGYNLGLIKRLGVTGSIEGGGGGQCHVGGFVGVNGGTIEDCFSHADVTGTEDGGTTYAGGFYGRNIEDGIVNRCYSIGAVSNTTSSRAKGFGGVNTSVSYPLLSFWDTTTSGQATSDGGTGKATADMKTAATFVGWSEDTWLLEDGAYPSLKSQFYPTRTYYLPLVQNVCKSLRGMFDQMVEWSDNSQGWDDIQNIRDLYGDGLVDLYELARAQINELGPLFPPVICDRYPAVTETHLFKNQEENFWPMTLVSTPLDSQRFKLSFAYGEYSIAIRDLIGGDIESWIADKSVLDDGGIVYKFVGGRIAVTMIDGAMIADADTGEEDGIVGSEEGETTLTYPTGVYEILDADLTGVYLNNELLFDDSIMAYQQTVDGGQPDVSTITSFLVRLIRKAEPQSGNIHVQYRASLDSCPDAPEPEPVP